MWRAFLILLLPVLARGQFNDLNDPGFVAGLLRIPCPDHTTYLIMQGFEKPTTGYDNCEVWAENGTVDADYTGIVLEGTQSLRLNEVAGVGAGETQTPLFATNTEVWVYFLMRPVTIQTGGFKALAGFRDTGGTLRWEMTLNADGTVRLASSGVATSVGTMSAGTTYSCWFHYQATVGLDFGFSTTGIRPTSGNNFVQLTDIQSGNACRLQLGRNSGAFTCDFVFDHVRVDDAQIGNSPP